MNNEKTLNKIEMIWYIVKIADKLWQQIRIEKVKMYSYTWRHRALRFKTLCFLGCLLCSLCLKSGLSFRLSCRSILSCQDGLNSSDTFQGLITSCVDSILIYGAKVLVGSLNISYMNILCRNKLLQLLNLIVSAYNCKVSTGFTSTFCMGSKLMKIFYVFKNIF